MSVTWKTETAHLLQKSTNFKIMIPTKYDLNEMPEMESSKMMLNTFK